MLFLDEMKEIYGKTSRWGHEDFVLTESDIRKLRKGKILLIDVQDEYTISIRLEKKKQSEGDKK